MRRNAHPFFCMHILVDTNLSVFSNFIFNSYMMSVSLFYDELP